MSGQTIDSGALLDAFDRIRDAAVKAFAVSRASARRDPIGRVQAEREFDVLFGVIQDEKRKASNSGVEPRRDSDVGSDPLLDMIAGVEDGWHWDDVLRLSAMELRRAGIGGDLSRKLNVMADKIESRMSNAKHDSLAR